MSFSSDVKEELARQYSKHKHCQVAELSAMIMQEGRIGMNPMSLSFETENPTHDLMDGISRFHVYVTPPSPNREIEFILEYDPTYIQTLFG